MTRLSRRSLLKGLGALGPVVPFAKRSHGGAVSTPPPGDRPAPAGGTLPIGPTPTDPPPRPSAPTWWAHDPTTSAWRRVRHRHDAPLCVVAGFPFAPRFPVPTADDPPAVGERTGVRSS